MRKFFFIPFLYLTSSFFAYSQGEFDDDMDEFGDFYSDIEFVSIATGTQTTLDKAPAIASVITAEDIKKRGVKNLTEALSMIPGLNVSRSSQIMSPKFNFRGITSTFSPQSLLMVNGTPLKSVVRGDNHIAWGEYPIHSIARIEVIRGPGSALYGADAFAGVINIITKGASNIESNTAGASIGSFNSKSIWFNGALTSNEYDVALSVEYSKSDGHKEIIVQDAQSDLDVVADNLYGMSPASLAPGSVNVGFEVLDIFLKSTFDKIQVNLGIQERGNLGTGQGVISALDPHGKVGGQKFIFDIVHDTGELASGWEIKSQLSYYRSSQEIQENLVLLPPDALFGTFPDGLIGNPEWEEDNASFNIKADYLSFKKHYISIGLGHSEAELFNVTEVKNFYPDLSPRPLGLEDISDTDEVFIPEASRSSSFVYAQDIWQIHPDWELTAGLRWDNYSDIGSTLNPRVALVWSTSLYSTTKFLYGRAFRAPAFAELLTVNNLVALGNPNLSPETIETYEVAYSVRSGEVFTTNINGFYYQIDDFINFVPDNNVPTLTAQNVGKREGYGLEIESLIDVSKTLRLKTNYSYVKAQDELQKNDVGDYPNHQFNLEVNWNITPSWNLNMHANVVGKRQRSPLDTRDALDGYSNLSCNVTYLGLGSGTELVIGAKNILDDDIFEPSEGPDTSSSVIDIPYDLPQAGASFNITFLKTF